jgi:hypothetical protein
MEAQATGDLTRMLLDDVLVSVQELHAIALLMEGSDLFALSGEAVNGGGRMRRYRCGVVLISMLERHLAALEGTLMAVDRQIG